jgi:hypothetical protein
MTPTLAVATAVTFVWLGMVLAISFMEAPLKFRAPDVTLRIGLGIGRLIFRALNSVEAIFAATLVACLVIAHAAVRIVSPIGFAIAVLGVQVALVRPRLTRRSDHVLANADGPRSRSHHAYIALEIAKVLALIVSGVVLLSA